jgi:protein-S-isoprenylcysteine O-methyltransferase Ste14
VQSVSLIIGLLVLFASAGKLDWINAWVYVVLVSSYWVISTIVLARLNPEILNKRGNLVKRGIGSFEKVWLAAYPILTFGNLVVMGLDAVRFHWSFMPFWLSFVGVLMFVFVAPLAVWAMVVNRFLDWMARIQDGQYVCVSGPYRIMRHPGYTGLLISVLAYPLVLGSWWGFMLSGIMATMIVIRTALEDRMLQKDLPGYMEYAKQVRYRLIPLIW